MDLREDFFNNCNEEDFRIFVDCLTTQGYITDAKSEKGVIFSSTQIEYLTQDMFDRLCKKYNKNLNIIVSNYAKFYNEKGTFYITYDQTKFDIERIKEILDNHVKYLEEIFINKIKIKALHDLEDLIIPFNKEKRKHLILTGKNGSGKTTLLKELNKFLENLFNNYKYWHMQNNRLGKISEELNVLKNLNQNTQKQSSIEKEIKELKDWLKLFGEVEINFTHNLTITDEINSGNFLVAYFDSKRSTSLEIPKGINKVELKEKYSPTEKAHIAFLQYIVNLKAERSFAKDDNDNSEVERIDKWFNNFESRLKDIFKAPSLKLEFNRKEYNFNIIIEGKEPFSISSLSDGYSAVFIIITELILRMELLDSNNYKINGIVLIDEIETHLHVELQKKILPFLTDFFPNIQFIITTHSPFVLSSLNDVIICDLEKKLITENLYGYSYESLVDSYFDTDKYSDFIKNKLMKYEEFSIKGRDNLNDEEKLEFLDMKLFFNKIPPFQNEELHIEISRINKINEKNSK